MDSLDMEFGTAYLADITPQSRLDALKEIYTEEKKNSEEFPELVNSLLQIAIIDEQLAELNYLYSYSLEKTEGKTDFDPEFQKHETEEREHKYELINRLRELDCPNIFAPMDQWKELNSSRTYVDSRIFRVF